MSEAIQTIPARSPASLSLTAGEVVRVINTHGSQVVDTWAFAASDPREHMSMEHSRVNGGWLIPAEGDVFYTNRRRPILRILEDSSGGPHDTLCAACDPERYQLLGAVGGHANCTENLHAELARLGLEGPERPLPTPCPLNLFQNVPPRADGRFVIEPPKARKGGHVALEAQMDAVVIFSACPMDMADTNGADRQPREAQFQKVAS